jgi:hypothetical protein
VEVLLLTLIGHLVAGQLHGAEANAALDPAGVQPPQLTLTVERTDVRIHPLCFFADVFELFELAAEDKRPPMLRPGGTQKEKRLAAASRPAEE